MRKALEDGAQTEASQRMKHVRIQSVPSLSCHTFMTYIMFTISMLASNVTESVY